MFSNPKKFLKKNILLIGICVFFMLIGIYFFMQNSKEGYEGNPPAKLIPVSVIQNMIVELGNTPDVNAILGPIIEMMTLIIDNYDDAYKAIVLIADVQTETNNVWAQPITGDTSQMDLINAANVIQQKAVSTVYPIITNLLPVIYKIFALQKSILNNLSNRLNSTYITSNDYMNSYIIAFINALFAENTLELLLGPDYATPLPTLPMTTNDKTDNAVSLINAIGMALDDYYNRILDPFLQVKMYASDHEIYQDLVYKLNGNLNVALANDVKDQATITHLKKKVKNLQSHK